MSFRYITPVIIFPLGLSFRSFWFHLLQPCRCAAVSNDSMMSFVAMSLEETMLTIAQKPDDRQFQSVALAGVESTEAGNDAEGVCG